MFPETTAYRQDEDPWRIVRLERVIGFITAINCQTLASIEKLHDHKGELSVHWRHHVGSYEMDCVNLAWLSPVGDGGDNVRHLVDGQDVRLSGEVEL